MIANPYHSILHGQYIMQLKLSTTATLETKKNGHCREVAVVEAETRVNVYGLSAQTKMAIVERWSLVVVRV